MTELGIELNDTSVELGIELGNEAINYNGLINKPQINGTTLEGNKTGSQLGLQDTLVSGTNIKTINNQSLLGSGNIEIQGGSDYSTLTNKPQINNVTLVGNKSLSDLGIDLSSKVDSVVTTEGQTTSIINGTQDDDRGVFITNEITPSTITSENPKVKNSIVLSEEGLMLGTEAYYDSEEETSSTSMGMLGNDYVSFMSSGTDGTMSLLALGSVGNESGLAMTDDDTYTSNLKLSKEQLGAIETVGNTTGGALVENDTDGLLSSLYLKNSSNYQGSRIDSTIDGAYYSKGANANFPLQYRAIADNELATKGDFTGLYANQWDEQWEAGEYNSVGEKVASTQGSFRSKNYISVLPSTSYYFQKGLYVNANIFFYDVNKTFISTTVVNTTFTTPSNCYYMNFYISGAGSEYDGNVSINYPSTDTNYRPYKEIEGYINKSVRDYSQSKLPTVTNDRYLHTNSSTGALEWSEVSGGVTDVQSPSGTSYVSSGIATIPQATTSALGTVKINENYKLKIASDGSLYCNTIYYGQSSSAESFFSWGSYQSWIVECGQYRSVDVNWGATTKSYILNADKPYCYLNLPTNMESISITMPTSIQRNRRMKIVFYSGASPTTLTISGNYLGTIPVPQANQRIELDIYQDGVNNVLKSDVMSTL